MSDGFDAASRLTRRQQLAKVFLSYDHGDSARVASIADALGKAGHSVWWDRHIHGGAEYSSEIESAVERSEAVIVFWSERSVNSAWVRDEAAEGRDQGKLIPVRIEAVKPPMGFRQYQTIDMVGRKKRGADVALGNLIGAIEAMSRPSSARSVKSRASPLSRQRYSPALIVYLVLAVVAVIAILLWRPWESPNSGFSVSVAAGDQSSESRSLAGNLLVQLGSLQASSPDVLDLVEPGTSAKADLIFKVVDVGTSPDPHASLSLVDNRADILLWSREFVQQGGSRADLRQQVAYSAGQVLRCATDALALNDRKLELPTLKLYLNGCSDLSNVLASGAGATIPAFLKVVEQAPTFAGGWAKLILAEMWAYRDSGFSNATLRRDLRTHIDYTRKRHPSMAEPALAEAWLQTPRPVSGWMRFAEEAVAKDPNHAEALINRATGLVHFGRLREAVDDVRRAVQAEPLYPAARGALIQTLMHSGATEQARTELKDAEQLWPGASNLRNLRFALEYQYGDPRDALQILQSGQLKSTEAAHQKSFLAARMDPSAVKIETSVLDALNLYRSGESRGFSIYVQTLAYFNRHEEAAKVLLAVDPQKDPGVIWVLFRPYFQRLHTDPRFMVIMKRFEVLTYFQETGKWPDFCSDPALPYDCRKGTVKMGS